MLIFMNLGIHFWAVFQNSFFQYFKQSGGARKTCSQNIENNLILFFLYYWLCSFNKKYEWFMVFLSTNIISDQPIKLKNHTVNVWEKCVSFKDIWVLRSGLTFIIPWLFS